MSNTLNPLETAKQLIKAYPFMYPTKWKVQCHLYGSLGGGYDWWSDGTLRDRGYEIKPSDFDRQYKMDECKPIKGFENDTFSIEMVARDKKMNEITKDFYDVIQKHADALADTRLYWILAPKISDMQYMIDSCSETYMNAFNFSDNIDKEWATDLREFLHEACHLLRANHNHGGLVESWTCEKAKKTYQMCEKHLNRLEVIMKIDNTAIIKMMKGIIDEIKTEDMNKS